MPRLIPYDPTRASLFRPGDATDFFAYGPYDSAGALCAEMARVVYVGKAHETETTRLAAYLERGGFELLEFANDEGSQGFVADDGKRAVMAFRGTEGDDPRDLWADLEFLPKSWRVKGKSFGRVHKGFADALDCVWTELAAAMPSGRMHLVTGHSLGAAMATLAATRFSPDGLYTYGSPRVGNTEFANSLRNALPCERYVNCCDMVTQLPPTWVGFKHVGARIYINRNGTLRKNIADAMVESDQSKAWQTYLRDHAWRANTVPVRDLADHAPINYVSATLRRRKPARARQGWRRIL